MTPTLQDLYLTESALLKKIEGEIKTLHELHASLKEAKAKLLASPYTDCATCPECNGAGRYLVSYSVGYDEYDYDKELCDHCLMNGVYPWDTNREWFDEEAAKASLDPTLDEDEREDALDDLLRDQAWDVEVDPPQVILNYDNAYYKMSDTLFSISQDLDILDHHYDTNGGGNQEWIATQHDLISKTIKEYGCDQYPHTNPRSAI